MSLQTTISNFTKIAESYPNGCKTLWEKEKLHVTRNFILFPPCFQKACFPGASKGVIVWKWVKATNHFIPLGCLVIGYGQEFQSTVIPVIVHQL